MAIGGGGFSGGGGRDSIGGPGGGPAVGDDGRNVGGRRDRPGGRRERSRSRESQRDAPIVAKRLRTTANQEELLSDSDTVAPAPKDPPPQTAEQIAARQATVRRQGRGQTILSGALGVAAGPNVRRPTLG